MMKYFYIPTQELQKQGIILHSCRCVLDSLIEVIESETRDTESFSSTVSLNPKEYLFEVH